MRGGDVVMSSRCGDEAKVHPEISELRCHDGRSPMSTASEVCEFGARSGSLMARDQHPEGSPPAARSRASGNLATASSGIRYYPSDRRYRSRVPGSGSAPGPSGLPKSGLTLVAPRHSHYIQILRLQKKSHLHVNILRISQRTNADTDSQSPSCEGNRRRDGLLDWTPSIAIRDSCGGGSLGHSMIARSSGPGGKPATSAEVRWGRCPWVPRWIRLRRLLPPSRDGLARNAAGTWWSGSAIPTPGAIALPLPLVGS